MMKFQYSPGATLLDPDESAGLIPAHITIQSELNEWEEVNILKAEDWLFRAKSHGNFLTSDFIKLVHEKMFNDTWSWAGEFRKSEKSIGVAPYNISTELKNLLEDVLCQIQNCDPYDIAYEKNMDEIACRFHHRLVAIHPFPNGNGRHARLITDFLLVQAGYARFTWGKSNLIAIGPIRKKYIAALRDADKYNYVPLITFVRS